MSNTGTDRESGRQFNDEHIRSLILESCIGMHQRPYTGKSPNGSHSSTQQTLGFVNKTYLKNNETRCLSEKDLLTHSEERNYTNNGQLQSYIRDDKVHQPPNKTSGSHQTDVYSS
jgi:hypothetical protein